MSFSKSSGESADVAAHSNFTIELGNGLTYVERPAPWRDATDPYLAVFWQSHKPPSLICELYLRGVPAPVSYVFVLRYAARVGSVTIDVEGLSAGATEPQFRRSGFFSCLIRETVRRSRSRVCLVFLKGIDGFYAKFGFVPCIPERRFRVSPRAFPNTAKAVVSLRPWNNGDSFQASRLYNEVNKLRPCSAVRNARQFQGPRPATAWLPGDDAVVAERDGNMVGYTLFGNLPYGQNWREFEVRELISREPDVSAALLAYLCDRASHDGKGALVVDDCEDSASGMLFKGLDCEYNVRYSRNGGWMASVVDTNQFADRMAPELRRRFGDACVFFSDRLRAMPDGRLDEKLLQLLLGMISWSDYLRSTPSWLPDTAWATSPAVSELPLSFIHSYDRF